jgi:hypothetical protein
MRSCLFHYLPVAALCAVIFANVNLGYYLRAALVERFGDSVFNGIYVVLAAVVAAVVAAIHRSREKRLPRFLLLAVLVAAYVRSLITIKYGVDKVHYFEYGLVGVAGLYALSKDFRPLAALAWSLLLLFFAGLTDETLQHFTPLRVAEISDVLLDVRAGAFGLGFALLLRRPSAFPIVFSRKEARSILLGLAFAALGAFFFLEQVHGYGFYISGTASPPFYSGLDSPKLAAVNNALLSKQPVAAGDRRTYDNEAHRHVFQRDFYLKNKFYYGKNEYFIEYGRSYRENAILEKYYPFYLDSSCTRWDSVIRAFVLQRQWDDPGWHSRVKETVITRVSRRTVRCVFAWFLFLLSVCIVLFSSRPLPDSEPK